MIKNLELYHINSFFSPEYLTNFLKGIFSNKCKYFTRLVTGLMEENNDSVPWKLYMVKATTLQT